MLLAVCSSAVVVVQLQREHFPNFDFQYFLSGGCTQKYLYFEAISSKILERREWTASFVYTVVFLRILVKSALVGSFGQ